MNSITIMEILEREMREERFNRLLEEAALAQHRLEDEMTKAEIKYLSKTREELFYDNEE